MSTDVRPELTEARQGDLHPTGSFSPAHRGGPGPEGAGQFIGHREVPGPRGNSCASSRRISPGFRGAAESTGPLVLSGHQPSGHQSLLEADMSFPAAETGSVDAHIRVPGPNGARRLCVQAPSLTAGGARLSVMLSFFQTSPQSSVARPAVPLCRRRGGSLPPGDTFLLGGPATRSPSDSAVVCQLGNFVCHACCGL